MKRILIQLISDESNQPSSKRIVGIMSSIVLCSGFFLSNPPAEYLVDAIALLSFGCLGLASLDKWTQRRSGNSKE